MVTSTLDVNRVTLPGQRERRTTSPWVSFLFRRLLTLVVSLVVLMVLTFALVRLIPGDPIASIAGLESNEADRQLLREQLGLDKPFLEQFWVYVSHLFQGDLGSSFITKQPVIEIIGQRLQVSGILAAFALAVVLLISVPFGMTAGALTRDDRNRPGELTFTFLTSSLGAVPEFLMATALAAVFGVWLRLVPIAGVGDWQSYILPVAALAIRPTLLLARIVRIETLNVLAQDYIRTARSKRLPNLRIYLRHVMPNVVTAALAVGGLLFAGLIGGAVLVESIFALPGLGTALVDAVIRSDYPVIQGIVLFLGAAVVIVNAIVDFSLAAIDPRTMAKAS